ncbi:MAG: hypothetical protein P0Y58_19960 [Candidatus Pseudomonas phytovorans]|uniref:Uncharacterized protein n=1 Tax=Candidatus Pseudomonas phytovorans TaxID=3121377 RepID=A0AAJ5WE28_9PSED|nr:hypothetical protein [Pseudomonas sp.]WEK29169.1 MAG: hypothetical protein P0Y58_19960 [Pseudomonas sp.]
MRVNGFFVFLVFASGLVQADLEIRSQSDNPRHAETLKRMQAAAAARPPSEVSIPSVEQLAASIAWSRRTGGIAATPPSVESPSRSAIEQLGCNLSAESPSGVARKEGGLNGILSLYECGTRQVATYEYSYAAALTQRVVVIDTDFAKEPDPLNPLIKTNIITVGERTMTTLRWLNRKHEIRYEVYADGSYAGETVFEKDLEAVLKATALVLIRGES